MIQFSITEKGEPDKQKPATQRRTHLCLQLSLHGPLLISNELCIGANVSQLQDQILLETHLPFICLCVQVNCPVLKIAIQTV